MTTDTTAPALLRSVGLMADGPGQWGRPVPASGPGVFVVELPAPLPAAPIELTRVGKWIERVETLRLDGERPTSKALAARLAAFWLPSQTILYVGASDASVRRRLAAIEATALGDRRPSAAGYWLKVLRALDGTKIWWAATTATEEYEDALLDAFADGVTAAERAGLPDPAVVLPFANLRRASGERKSTGLTGALLAEPVVAPAPPTRVVVVPDGDAEGAHGEPPPPRSRVSERPVARPAGPRRSVAAVTRDRLAAEAAAEAAQGVQELTVEGAARLRAELEELTQVRRPQVIARIRTAKEHGDLKENAEYHAAREEQGFLEGRIKTLESKLKIAVVVAPTERGANVELGSHVRVEVDGEETTMQVVSSAEANSREGRISSASPVGAALMGRKVGDVVTIVTPGGEIRYAVLEIS
ncbi:MAG TPA: transcription elongation factor GreA [Candidatus Limnocylindrales bacterium]